MTTVTYFWRYHPSGDASDHFDDQGAAEEWLSAHWRDLADQGVDEVTLMDDTETVYGPMSLHAP
ncbi:hypothetical protein Actkin_01551 [Actinokineospora sp. UTMC 2448]|nr:hypothetical protein Actkin_01551 [Actinokineospora sp. UTMC 2448]